MGNGPILKGLQAIADFMGVHLTTVRKMADNHGLPVMKVKGTQVQASKNAIEAWVIKHADTYRLMRRKKRARVCEIHCKGKWIKVHIREVKKGMLFRLYEPTGVPVKDKKGNTVWRAKKDSYQSASIGLPPGSPPTITNLWRYKVEVEEDLDIPEIPKKFK